MASELEYESVLCVKPDVSVYRIPPRASNRGYRASDWKLDQPDWTGRLRITSKGKIAYIKLEDKISGTLDWDPHPLAQGAWNITTKKGGASKPKSAGTGGLSLLPPPPGGKVTIPPPTTSVPISNHVTPPPIPKSNHGGNDADILLDLDSPAPVTTPAPAPVSASNDLWGDFSTASSSVPNQAPQPSNWVQF
nr:unnamed protein product [Sorex araneus]